MRILCLYVMPGVILDLSQIPTSIDRQFIEHRQFDENVLAFDIDKNHLTWLLASDIYIGNITRYLCSSYDEFLSYILAHQLNANLEELFE